MSYVKSVPLKKLFQYTQDDDEVVLLASTNEQPEDAAQLADALSGEISVDNAAAVTALGGNPEENVTLSNTGGANKIAQFDSNGNLVLRPLRPLSDTGGIVVDGGNLILTDRQQVGWYASDSPDGYGPTGSGKFLFRIRQDNGHPYETNIDASGSICFYWGESTAYRGMQFGNAQGGSHFIYMQAGPASVGTQTRPSVPVAFRTQTWNGSATQSNYLVAQGVALDTTGTNSAIRITQNTTNLGSSDTPNGTTIAEIAGVGIWSNGTAPAFDTLADGATVTQTCSKFKTVQAAKVTLAGNRTLAISGAIAGMRGVIYVSQDGTGSRTLALPEGSATPSGWALSTIGRSVDRLCWEYDGTYYFWTIDKGITLPADSDAAAFFTRASITDDTQEAAVNNLVLSLKADGVWAKLAAIYPFVGGNETAHSKNLKADQYNLTFFNSPTHDANGITGNGSNAYASIGTDLATLGLADSFTSYLYSRTQTPTDNGYFCGATTATTRNGLQRTSANVTAHGANSQSTAAFSAASDFRKSVALTRENSTTGAVYLDGVKSNCSSTSVSAPNVNYFILARNNTGSPSGYTDANLAFFALGEALNESEVIALNNAVEVYQAALSRANP